MKKKIKELFKEYYKDETMPVVELEEKVLALFDVVARTEQLCPKCKVPMKPLYDKMACFKCLTHTP